MKHCKQIWIFLLLLLTGYCYGQAPDVEAQEPISRLGEYSGYNTDDYRKFKKSSSYLPMRDSVLLATDLYLPEGLEEGKQIPTILYLTRYVRAMEPSASVRWLAGSFYGTVSKKEIAFFTNKGYACMVVDVRGTGASTGSRSMEFSPAEIADGAELVDWIISQSWSNGKVGSAGISYLANTAEMLLTNQHPAVRACVSRSGIYDLYANVIFPGGVKQDKFIEVWRNSTYALDNSQFGFFSLAAGLLVKGVQPVETDKDREILEQAVVEHQNNFDIFPPLAYLTFRDEAIQGLGESIDLYSLHQHKEAIIQSGVPVYRISGWYDGANINGAIQGYLANEKHQKLLIGPWDHGQAEFISPFGKGKKIRFSVWDEMLRFFDFYLKDIQNGIQNDASIHYYNMGKEEWRSVASWPIPETEERNLYFSADSTLVGQPEKVETGAIPYQVTYSHETGRGSRWNSLTPAYRYERIGYPKWKKQAADLLHFSTPVLEEDLEMTGHPEIELYLQIDATDATVFVYLQDMAPNGELTYITEGQFRAIHRKESREQAPYPQIGPYHSFKKADALEVVPNEPFRLRFTLLPTSYLVRKGHRLQVAIAGTDREHFEVLENPPEILNILINEEMKTKLKIPIRPVD